ncbi:hypothetical protein RclHR1_00690011 [Rhizophagus clarus]|uniref:Uncharacterized protein n=1 Tax=Rhizophagus clarus TaxID=94130 RepID=A0A2Z6RW42_9GLOM|nr:hypothetical protein RclHR1_00690011 [Rhizophagus clarus]
MISRRKGVSLSSLAYWLRSSVVSVLFSIISEMLHIVSLVSNYIEKKSYSTQYSHVVPNRSTDWAISGLTSEIGRVPVLFTVYGRNCERVQNLFIYKNNI